MPVLISNGKRYRVPFMSLLRGGLREERYPYDMRNVSAHYYPDALVAAKIGRIVEDYALYKPVGDIRGASVNPGQAHIAYCTVPWTADDDRLLRQLRTSKVSWRRIATVMDDRPIEELKHRWADIRNDRRKLREVYELTEVADDWSVDNEDDGEQSQVSFSRLHIDDDTGEDDDTSSMSPKVKRVYYIDDEFTLDEVLLLHRIAANWRKDRWKTISSQFNDMTGRSISPAQAKSVIVD
ncbi:SANT/Myb-like DNA-binding domain-containing protein [Aspergillus lucknowensis]|uniref:Myb-like domain-containing protein n=1 Tax=Aspergillus lucknowensis TaxID=176173 RepID=A0ABR4M5V1_9EURO